MKYCCEDRVAALASFLEASISNSSCEDLAGLKQQQCWGMWMWLQAASLSSFAVACRSPFPVGLARAVGASCSIGLCSVLRLFFGLLYHSFVRPSLFETLWFFAGPGCGFSCPYFGFGPTCWLVPGFGLFCCGLLSFSCFYSGSRKGKGAFRFFLYIVLMLLETNTLTFFRKEKKIKKKKKKTVLLLQFYHHSQGET